MRAQKPEQQCSCSNISFSSLPSQSEGLRHSHPQSKRSNILGLNLSLCSCTPQLCVSQLREAGSCSRGLYTPSPSLQHAQDKPLPCTASGLQERWLRSCPDLQDDLPEQETQSEESPRALSQQSHHLLPAKPTTNLGFPH